MLLGQHISSSPHSFFFLKIFFFFFLLWTIFKVLIEVVTISFLFYVLGFWPGSMRDLGSLTRGGTHTLCFGRLNYWTAREVPGFPTCGRMSWTKTEQEGPDLQTQDPDLGAWNR